MADNVAITAGSGTSIATDDCGAGGHVQIVKLAVSTDGSATPIDATDGLLVNLGANNDVAVTSVIPGTGATNLGKPIDGAAGATDTGVAPLAVRVDALSALTPAEGDYVPLRTNANGALWVIPSGTTEVSGTVTTNLAALKAEDSASADADVGIPAMAVRKATPANTSGTDGDYEMLQMSAGRLWTSATIDAALPAGTNAIGKLAANSGVDIGDTDVTSVIPGTGATNLGKAIDVAAGASDTGVAPLAVRDDALATLTPADGDWAPLRVDDKGGLWVGGTAHDAADTGNPIKLGARADSSLKANTMVADADRTDLIADVDGQLLVKPLAPFTDIINERVTDTGGTSTALTNFSAVASTRNYVTTIAVYNSSATAGFVDFRDGTGGAVLFTLPLPAGGGSVISFPVPLRQPTTNTALAFDVSAALSTVYISLIGFQSKA